MKLLLYEQAIEEMWHVQHSVHALPALCCADLVCLVPLAGEGDYKVLLQHDSTIHIILSMMEVSCATCERVMNYVRDAEFTLWERNESRYDAFYTVGE